MTVQMLVPLANKRTPLVTAVSILFYFEAFAWGVGVIPTLYYALTYKVLPTVVGIRLMGGPFESLGIDALIVAGIVFVVVSALKVLAAYWLWHNRKDGAVLGLVLIWTSAMFWHGFALPLGPPLGIAELVLLIAVWRTLNEPGGQSSVSSPDGGSGWANCSWPIRIISTRRIIVWLARRGNARETAAV
jgi:hypothetical protein